MLYKATYCHSRKGWHSSSNEMTCVVSAFEHLVVISGAVERCGLIEEVYQWRVGFAVSKA